MKIDGSGLFLEDCEPIFHILDSDYGCGDALVPLATLQEALDRLPEQEAAAEDEIGSVFGAFMDKSSLLEMISFRCGRRGPIDPSLHQFTNSLPFITYFDLFCR